MVNTRLYNFGYKMAQSYVCQVFKSHLGPLYQESVRAKLSWPAERILAKI